MSVSRGGGRSHNEPLLDFPELTRRVRASAWTLGGLAAVGVLVDLAGGGAVAAALARWAAAGIAGVLLVAAVLVALQAYRAADAVQRRGQRLSADDVGLAPPRRPDDG